MNYRTALAMVLLLSLTACTLMGVAAVAAEASDATSETQTDITILQDVTAVGSQEYEYELYGKTIAKEELFGVTPEKDCAVAESAAVTNMNANPYFPEINGSVLLPLNAQEAAISVSSWFYDTDGCTEFLGSNATGTNFDVVIPYTFNNPEDM